MVDSIEISNESRAERATAIVIVIVIVTGRLTLIVSHSRWIASMRLLHRGSAEMEHR